jgi:hypothetical protein
MISRIARSRRAMARPSYRSSRRNSGSALHTVSAVRSGSWFGIVARESTGCEIRGGLPRGVLVGLDHREHIVRRIELAARVDSVDQGYLNLPNTGEIEHGLRCGAGVLKNDFIPAVAGDVAGEPIELLGNCWVCYRA